MVLSALFWNSLLAAAGLGLAAALSLWLLRRSEVVRRLRVSALLAVLAGGLYLVLIGLGQPPEAFGLRIVLSASLFLGANAALELVGWLIWEQAVGRRRQIVVPRLVVDVFNLAVLTAVAIGLLSSVFGVRDLSAVLVTSTVLSAVIGLAVQDTLGNVASGLALQAEQPFRVGDWVLVSGQEGQVAQMNWRTITLRSGDNHYVLLPNSQVARDTIVNYSRPTPLQRCQVDIQVHAHHPPGLVKRVLADAVTGAPGIAGEPKPHAQLESYGDSALHYRVVYWVTTLERLGETQDAVLTRLWYALRRADMTLPFPARDVTVQMRAADHAEQAQANQLRENFVELRRITLFEGLDDSVLERMARGSALRRYTAGEVLVRQGEPGDSLFVIRSGQVRVELRVDGGPSATLNRLGPNDFFGEMSLLTGEPRSASVIAETEAEVVVVEKADVAAVITAESRLPELLSVALAARQRQQAEHFSAAGPAEPRAAHPTAAVLSRIRRFFSLG